MTNEQVNNFLKNTWGWVGGKRELGNETFVWSDCSPWAYNSGWRNGEPNNARGNEACVNHIFGKWSDENCDLSLKFVCSIPICSGITMLMLTTTEEVESIYSTYTIKCTMYQQTSSTFQLRSLIVCISRWCSYNSRFNCSSDECTPRCAPGWEEFVGKCKRLRKVLPWGRNSLFLAFLIEKGLNTYRVLFLTVPPHFQNLNEKNLLSQLGPFLHWKFLEKIALVYCNLIFNLVLKIGRTS